MRKNLYLVFITVFLLLCALPAVFMPFAYSSETKENRTLSEPPKLFENGTVNRDFGADTETWFSEHFAGRNHLVALHAKITQALFATSTEPQVILGKDGWLFYEPTLEDYLGTQPYSPREQNALAATLRLMQQYVLENGGRFAATVAPNKNSIYGEYMPAYTVSARSESSLAALADILYEQGVAYVDLYDLLREEKGETLLYHKRDTHWNNYGARLAYNALMDGAAQPHNAFEDTVYTVESDWDGDLDAMLLPIDGIPDEQMYFDIPFSQLFRYRGSDNVEMARIQTSGTGSGSLLMYRDSFGNALLPFVATAFQDATFLRANPYDLTRMEAGQVVIVEIVQRNLRALLGAAPIMPAPCDPTMTIDRQLFSAGCSLYTVQSGDWLQVYGALDPGIVEDDARVFILAGKSAYEAFPCSETLPDGSVPDSGYGYSARIKADDLTENTTFSLALLQGGERIEIVRD